jgi:hypothetical protein
MIILMATALTTLVAALIGTAAGCLARRDHASWPQAIARAAATFAAVLSLTAVLVEALHNLIL